jgi:hypothetical protein
MKQPTKLLIGSSILLAKKSPVKHLRSLWLIILGLAFVLCQSPVFVSALSDAQKQVFESGVLYFDAEEAGSGSCISEGTLPSSVPDPYNGIFTQAGSKYNTSPALIAAIFYAGEHGSSWPNSSGPWAFSNVPPSAVWWDGAGVGARGPFQFEPYTWFNPGAVADSYVNSNPAHQVDVHDLTAVSKSADDLTDSAFGAAKKLSRDGGSLGSSDSDIKRAILAYNNSESYANTVLAAYHTFLQGSSDSGSASCAVGSGSGVVLDGHTFPLPLQHQSDYDTFGALSQVPCPTSSCHHDGTPAFDLGMKGYGPDGPEGAPTLAISDGYIKNINYNYTSPEGVATGCNSIEFQSNDGYVYWYGHLAHDESIKDGQQFKVGQQMGKIGPRICTGNGSTPHLHIDRGSPKGHDGGEVCCRDPGMINLINGLFEVIPK